LYNVILSVSVLIQPNEGKLLEMCERMSNKLPPLRILLVEDSPTNQKLALAVLSHLDHTIAVANHGAEALQLLAGQDFDVVLMDVQMPVMDGIEATAAIRASEKRDGTHQPIVAITAHSMAGDRQRCLNAGVDQYVSKPFRRDQLLQAIAAAIEVGSVPHAADRSGSRSLSKVVDWNVPLAQVMGDHAHLKEITNSYLIETQKLMSRLPVALAEGNARETNRLAHTVKGAMRFFVAEVATDRGQELEDLAAAGNLEEASELFTSFESEVDHVIRALQRFVDTGEM
jgi:two-component system, sensor histidine kinase and response regulator